MEGYRIGEMARLAGVPTGTIRFYERAGLIAPPPRTPAGYRKYTVEALTRLRMVLRARKLGFNLAEIGELIDMLNTQRHPCANMHCRLTLKLAELDGRITMLNGIKAELQRLTERCSPATAIDHCPVLQILSHHGNIAAQITAPEDEPE